MRKKTLLLTAAVIALIATACSLSGDNEDNHVTQTYTYTDCFYIIKDLHTGNTTYSQDAGITVQFTYNYGSEKVTTKTSIGIKGVPSSMGTNTVQFNDLPTKVSSHETLLIEQNGLHPVNVTGMTVNSLRFEWLFRSFQTQEIPVVQLYMTIDDRYELTLVPRNLYLFGESTVNAANGDAPYKTDKMWYQITLNPAKPDSSAIFVHEARFSEKMPRAMDMNFPGVLYTPTGNNTYTMTAESTIPTISKVPYPSFEIQNIKGSGNYDGYMNLSFIVKGMGTVSAKLAPAQILAAEDD